MASPNLACPKTLTLEPTLWNLLIETEEPKKTVSRRDIDDPSLIIPYNDKLDPILAKLFKLKLEPK
jgi:hypothetical protein